MIGVDLIATLAVAVRMFVCVTSSVTYKVFATDAGEENCGPDDGVNVAETLEIHDVALIMESLPTADCKLIANVAAEESVANVGSEIAKTVVLFSYLEVIETG